MNDTPQREITLAEYVARLRPTHSARIEYERMMSNPIQICRCGFCKKGRHEVKKMIEDHGKFICEGCVTLYTEMLSEEEMGES